MSNKALSPIELEVTQRIQMHFPRGLRDEVLTFVNSCPVDRLTAAIGEMLEKLVDGAQTLAEKLLEFITTVPAVAIERFVAADHFIKGQTIDGVKIAYMSPDFERLMLPLAENVEALNIRIHRLQRDSRDLGIRVEIGEANEAVKLGHFFQVLKAKATDAKIGTWVVAYIYGIDGNLWAVFGFLYGGGWDLYVCSVGGPSGWVAGSRFCSR